ncbi:MAG: hypothetical protein NC318_14025 [Blautia sp.]|nr:hypothetical protein [Lachnoclostridium sp.]MCM1212702.1 hypothetical protein [Blautia sp.]
MGKEKIVLATAFVAAAMVSGSIVSVYAMNQSSVEAKGAPQTERVVMVQPENGKMAQAEMEDIIQIENAMFFCKVPGCIQTEVHQHGLCGIDGCTQIGEHSHDICSIAGCTETGTHMHDGEFCYPHSADDGHAYHNCGVSGCTEAEHHTHGSCGIDGCTQIGEHSHEKYSGNHHQSRHHGGHHH